MMKVPSRFGASQFKLLPFICAAVAALTAAVVTVKADELPSKDADQPGYGMGNAKQYPKPEISPRPGQLPGIRVQPPKDVPDSSMQSGPQDSERDQKTDQSCPAQQSSI